MYFSHSQNFSQRKCVVFCSVPSNRASSDSKAAHYFPLTFYTRQRYSINELLWSNKVFMLYLEFWLDRRIRGLGPRNWGYLISFNHSPSSGTLPRENIFWRVENFLEGKHFVVVKKFLAVKIFQQSNFILKQILAAKVDPSLAPACLS